MSSNLDLIYNGVGFPTRLQLDNYLRLKTALDAARLAQDTQQVQLLETEIAAHNYNHRIFTFVTN